MSGNTRSTSKLNSMTAEPIASNAAQTTGDKNKNKNKASASNKKEPPRDDESDVITFLKSFQKEVTSELKLLRKDVTEIKKKMPK